MRICFVGHAFHEKSRSSGFMLDVLNEIGATTIFRFDPDADANHLETLVLLLSRTDFDVYVFFQTEHVAERVQHLVAGRIIIVPMYDAARQRPTLFWTQFVEATFISFCRAHHEVLSAHDMRSFHFQYFPPATTRYERAPGGRDAFFWERRPDQRLNVNVVIELCRRLGVTRLHVHGAPDFVIHDHRRYDRLACLHAASLAITHSSWFEDKRDYEAVASAPLFFFAPRETEGIGLACLEAMARGQIVVAPDRPVLDEYVADMTSGILYDLANPGLLEVPSAARLERMSDAAFTKAVYGRADWLEDVERLKSIVLNDGRRWSTSDVSSRFCNELRAAASQRVFVRGEAVRRVPVMARQAG